MKKIFKGLGLGIFALALVITVGANSANAALTLGALTVTSDGALTVNGAATSNIVLGGTSTSGTIAIGALNTGGITIGNGDTIKTISIGAGNAVNTIKIGDHATPVNVITIGGAASSLALADAQWSVTSPGVATFVNALVTAHADTGVDTLAAGALSLGNTTATSVSLCNDSPNCDSVLIATDSDGGTITIGNVVNSAVSIFDDNWSVTTAGVATFASVNKVAITAPATSATLTIADGKTLTASKTITLTSAGDLSVITLPNATDTLVGLATVDTITGAKTFGSAGAVGKLIIAGTTSGTTILNAAAIAGSTTITMPGTTGTMALKPMTTGGDIVYGGASGVETRLANGTVGQVLRSGGTTVAPTWATFVAELGGANTWTGVNTFGAAGAVSRLKIAGTTSGSLTLDTDATAGTAVITIPAVTDTLVGKATTDILTNKTLTTPVINGAVTTTGLTLPAVTLGGVVSGGGQQVNNVIIGTVTPLAGAFTTLTGQSLATSAASPLLLTNGQLVTVALTSQTTGGVTLTIPDFADVDDEFVFKTKAVTMSNKTFVAPVLGVASATSLATSAASPLLLTNGQLVTVALTSQTTGVTTLTIPDFAGVVDEFTFKTKSQTLSNKTFVAPVLGAATGTSINLGTTTLLDVLSELTASIDLASAAAGVCVVATDAVTNAALGDTVTVNPSLDDAGWDIGGLTAFVESAGVVKITYCNNSAGASDVAAMTYRLTILQF